MSEARLLVWRAQGHLGECKGLGQVGLFFLIPLPPRALRCEAEERKSGRKTKPVPKKKRSARVASAVQRVARRHCACGPHSGCLSNPESGGVQLFGRVTFPAHPLSRSHVANAWRTKVCKMHDGPTTRHMFVIFVNHAAYPQPITVAHDSCAVTSALLLLSTAVKSTAVEIAAAGSHISALSFRHQTFRFRCRCWLTQLGTCSQEAHCLTPTYGRLLRRQRRWAHGNRHLRRRWW